MRPRSPVLTCLPCLLPMLFVQTSLPVLGQTVSPGITMVPPRIIATMNSSAVQAAGGSPGYLLSASPAPLEALDSHLPGWIQFSGLDRLRFEGYAGLNYRPGNEDFYVLNRFRLGMLLRPAAWFKVYSEVQDARDFLQRPPLGPPNENTWNLRQAYVELGRGEDAAFGVKVGRQEVNFGAGRVIGRSDWRNAGRTFDAALAALRFGRYRLTAFSLSRVNPVAHGMNHHQQGNVIHGLYGAIDTLIPHSVLEPYVFWKLAPGVRNESAQPARINEHIAGLRWAGLLTASVDYAAEYAFETGNFGSDPIGASMVSIVTGYTMLRSPGAPRLFAEYFFASGDRKPGDQKHGTWDQLHPTHHDRNGLSDQIGFQNLKEFRTGVRFLLSRNWALATEYNNWYLASATDALYDTAPSIIARDPTGKSGTHVGQEVDLQMSYRLSRQLEIGAGIAHLFPGEFLRRTTPGHAYTYPYFMLAYSLR